MHRSSSASACLWGLCCGVLVAALPACDALLPAPPLPDAVSKLFTPAQWSTLKWGIDPLRHAVYVAARCPASGGLDQLYVAKIDQTGVIEWQRGPADPTRGSGPAGECDTYV